MTRPPPGVRRTDPRFIAIRCLRSLRPAHAAALAAPLPAAVDNSRHPDTNQGQSSACTAHALVKCVEIVTGFSGSEHVLYSLSGTRGGENPLVDDGRCLSDCLAVIQTMGLAPFEGPSPDGRNSDVWTADDTSVPPNVCVAATAAEIGAASEHVYAGLGLNSIDPADSNVSNLVAACLAAGGAVYLGTQVGQAFEQLGGTTIAQPDPANDPNGGGHALALVGYRTASDGSRQFRVQNSWGESWDDAGECWASLAWLQACWELHPLVPASPAPPTILQSVEDELRAIV